MFGQHDVLITHDGCMDGSACAIIFAHYGGRKENIYYSSPSHSQTDIISTNLAATCSGVLFIADVSVSEEAARLLDKQRVMLFDHHKSAIPLKRHTWCEIEKSNKRCGSLMFLDFCEKNSCARHSSLRRFVEIVDDRDRWIHKIPEASHLADLFKSLGSDLFFHHFIQYGYDFKDNPQLCFLSDIERQKKDAYLLRIIRKVEISKIDGYKIGFTICDHRYLSDVGHYLCQELQLDGVVMITPESVSLRAPAESKLDMSVIAKIYGGGGHKGAAGFQTSALIGESLLSQAKKGFYLP